MRCPPNKYRDSKSQSCKTCGVNSYDIYGRCPLASAQAGECFATVDDDDRNGCYKNNMKFHPEEEECPEGQVSNYERTNCIVPFT